MGSNMIKRLLVATFLILRACVCAAQQVPSPINAITGMPSGHIFESTSNIQKPQDGGVLGSMANQAASSVAITGGSVNGTPIGNTIQATGSFTTLSGSVTATGSTTARTLAARSRVNFVWPARLRQPGTH